MRTGEIIAAQDLGGVELLTLKSGVVRVFKGDEYSKYGEITSYHIDKLIGTNAFPLTVTRNAGSLQLFIESLPQRITETPVQTDFNRKYITYVDFMDFTDLYKHTESEYDKKVQTLFVFSMDADGGHNKLIPLQGRSIKIDGAMAIDPDHALHTLLPNMQKNPQILSFAPELIARLKTIDAQKIKQTLQPYLHPHADIEEIVRVFQILQQEYLRLGTQ